ncbi:MAG: hypothetical protein IT323_01895 [Anaerolineae bacterium]|nr:hypothetical protein [Anaerolineae bacterium]
MEYTTPHLLADESRANDTFIYLLFGLDAWARNKALLPNSLRRALNGLAAQATDFPRTLHAFVALCHRPVGDWYPYGVPSSFTASQPLLYDGHLSEEAQEFCLDCSEQVELSPSAFGDVPQTVLDNLVMVQFLKKLRAQADAAAQEQYVRVRSYLIEHSWTTHDQLRANNLRDLQELRKFYEEVPGYPVSHLMVCDRCGLLEWRDGRWQGVKPGFCSDHSSQSPHLHAVPNTHSSLRLKRGIHLRTFLPGRLELALFCAADTVHDEHPAYLCNVERYPGLDAYDLRLTFSDGDIWAIDAKDHADPERLAQHIHPMPNEGNLAHSIAFYVLPDARRLDVHYREAVEEIRERVSGPNLRVVYRSEFEARIRIKVGDLMRPSRRRQTTKGPR